METAVVRSRIPTPHAANPPSMARDDTDQPSPAPPALRDRLVDWLGAQGPSRLTIYMCGAVALVAFCADAMS